MSGGSKQNKYVDIGGGVLVPTAVMMASDGTYPKFPSALGQAAAAASVPVVETSSVAPFSILGTVNAVSTLTRLANTTAYTAGDEISDIASSSAHPWVFANAGLAVGGSGRITKVRLQASDPLCVSQIFRLYLFDTAPAMVGDNLAYALLAAEFAGRDDYIDIGPLITSVGAGVAEMAHDLGKDYVCAAASTSLYGVLVIQNAYSPLSAGTFRLELTVRRAS